MSNTRKLVKATELGAFNLSNMIWSPQVCPFAVLSNTALQLFDEMPSWKFSKIMCLIVYSFLNVRYGKRNILNRQIAFSNFENLYCTKKILPFFNLNLQLMVMATSDFKTKKIQISDCHLKKIRTLAIC